MNITKKRKVFHTGDSDVVSIHPDWLKEQIDKKRIIPNSKGEIWVELTFYDDYATIRPIKENDISVQQ